MKWLAYVAKKHTTEPLSDVIEVEAPSEYRVVQEVEKITGVTVNGWDNYVNMVALENTDGPV